MARARLQHGDPAERDDLLLGHARTHELSAGLVVRRGERAPVRRRHPQVACEREAEPLLEGMRRTQCRPVAQVVRGSATARVELRHAVRMALLGGLALQLARRSVLQLEPLSRIYLYCQYIAGCVCACVRVRARVCVSVCV